MSVSLVNLYILPIYHIHTFFAELWLKRAMLQHSQAEMDQTQQNTSVKRLLFGQVKLKLRAIHSQMQTSIFLLQFSLVYLFEALRHTENNPTCAL